MQNANSKNDKRFLGVMLFLALGFYAIFIFRSVFTINNEIYFSLIDDAMISMRYAKHLANGYGLVWNIGEPPVQGFTNMGWTLYMAVLHKFPVAESKMSLLVMISSVFLLLWIAYFAYKLTKLLASDSEIAPKIALIVTAFYFPVVFWSLRGMELGLTTLLILALAAEAIDPARPISYRRSLVIGVLMLLAILARIDMIVQVGLVLVYLLYRYAFKQKAGIAKLSPALVLLMVAVVGLPLFQYQYFGSVMPNTYALKVEGVSIAIRIAVGLQAFVTHASRDLLALLFIVLIGLLMFKDLRTKEVTLFLGLFLVQCAYSIYVGGDYSDSLWGGWTVEAANRFVSQGMPFLIILFSIVIERILKSVDFTSGRKDYLSLNSYKSSLNLAVLIGLAVVMIVSGEPWFEWTLYNAPGIDADVYKTSLGVLIRDNTDEDAVIAVHSAGRIPYFSNRTTIDLLGKNDPVIANGPPSPLAPFLPGHNKWNYTYSIGELQPDIVAEEWGFLPEYMEQQPNYTRLDNGIWVRNDSTRIDVDGLDQAYREQQLVRGAEACEVTAPEWFAPPEDAAIPDEPVPAYYVTNEDRSIIAGAWWWEDQDYPLTAGERGNKVGWFRPEGAELEITGRRVDGDAPAMEAEVPCCYPTRFQATGLYFPTGGCWEIVAEAGGSELTFIVWVEPAP